MAVRFVKEDKDRKKCKMKLFVIKEHQSQRCCINDFLNNVRDFCILFFFYTFLSSGSPVSKPGDPPFSPGGRDSLHCGLSGDRPASPAHCPSFRTFLSVAPAGGRFPASPDHSLVAGRTTYTRDQQKGELVRILALGSNCSWTTH